MIDAAAARYQAFAQANADLCGLYEVFTALTTLYPKEIAEERLRAAKDAVRHLHQRGWVYLWFASWTDPETEARIEADHVESTLENPYWWESHLDRMVWFYRTETGALAWSRPADDLRAELAQPLR